MPFAELYRKQVALLIRVLPLVAREKSFALKGGTAINLFVRNMPRLSVDIDLTYLPIAERVESLAAIDTALKLIAGSVPANIRGAQITEGITDNAVTNLLVRAEGAQIKIEVNPVVRGCVYEAEMRSVSESVEFGVWLRGSADGIYPRPLRRQGCRCARSTAPPRSVRYPRPACQ